MSGTNWHIKGDYFETCSCDYLCPCIFTNMTAMPTDGVCKVAIVMDIAEGHFGDVQLGGVCFITAAQVDGPMADGNWTIGLIIDDKASDAQVEAIGKICSGDEGGPMALMAPLVGTFGGIERAPITIERKKMGFAITAGDLLRHGADGYPSLPDPEQPIYLDNTGHPANKRLALAKGTHSHLHAFGIDWDDAAGGHNGHFAPFDWQPA
jgi:hypothetical protein